MPCFSQAKLRALSEQLPDLSVNIAKEVHVGGSTVQALILHQELTEQHLRFVLLPHNLELGGKKGSKCDLFLVQRLLGFYIYQECPTYTQTCHLFFSRNVFQTF